MHRPVQPFDEVPSFLGSCIFRLGQQRVSGSPLPRVPSAAPATNLRVAPHLRSIWLCRRWIFESPRNSHPSAVLVSLKSRVAPILQFLLQRLRCRPQVALRPASPALPVMGSSGCPESLILRRCRLADLRVSPAFGPSVSPTIRFPDSPFQVPPDRESSGFGWWLPEFPRGRTFRFCHRLIFRSPRIFFSGSPKG